MATVLLSDFRCYKAHSYCCAFVSGMLPKISSGRMKAFFICKGDVAVWLWSVKGNVPVEGTRNCEIGIHSFNTNQGWSQNFLNETISV